MNETRRLSFLLRAGHARLNRSFFQLGCSILLLLMVLTVVDVTGRYLFNTPLLGMFELTEFMLVSLVFMGMGHQPGENGHLAVALFTKSRQPKTRLRLRLFNAVISAIFLLLVASESAIYSLRIKDSGDVSAILHIPVYPFIMLVSIGAINMAVGLILGATQQHSPGKSP